MKERDLSELKRFLDAVRMEMRMRDWKLEDIAGRLCVSKSRISYIFKHPEKLSMRTAFVLADLVAGTVELKFKPFSPGLDDLEDRPLL